MMPAGYLIKRQDGLHGTRGLAYDYIMAGNGLWIEAESRFISVRLPASEAPVRGLPPLDVKVVLRYGKIPQRLFDLAIDIFVSNSYKEKYVAIARAGDEYRLRIPNQQSDEASIKYVPEEDVVVDIHSHAHMDAFFSDTDNADEQGFKIYAVVGRVDTVLPRVMMRVGCYGYFFQIPWEEVFEGQIKGARECEMESRDNVKEDAPAVIPIVKPAHLARDRWWNRLLHGKGLNNA